jgi:transposase
MKVESASMKCPRCGSEKFWVLSSGQKRCSRCRLTRKFDKTLWQSTNISPYWKGRLLEFFCLGVPAYRLRFQVPLDRKTIQRWFRVLREAIYQHDLKEKSELSGQIEMDETMFGGKVPGKRGLGAAGKHMVLGIYQRNGMVLTFPITSRGGWELIPLMTKHTKPGSLYYTDDWHAYTFLDIRGDHVVIRKEKGKPKGRDHINGIEGFWSYAKHWLYHYRGVPRKYFHLYLKEIEWRFNHRNENLVKLLRTYMLQLVVKDQF